jgi:hypothetical protein
VDIAKITYFFIGFKNATDCINIIDFSIMEETLAQLLKIKYNLKVIY